ncbi:hypothetical protein PG987_011893 [Apiospora arundinis]
MAPSLEEPEPVDDVIENPLKSKPQLVAPEPEHCPGPESEQAGKADNCAGCPNQAICASAPKGPDPDIPIISARLSGIKHKILHGLEPCLGLRQPRRHEHTVHAPEPRRRGDMAGPQEERPHQTVSQGCRLGRPGLPAGGYTPGTSDEHLSVNSFLKESGIDGAVMVTTPQEVALLDVRKEIDFCRKAGIKVLGIVENMSGGGAALAKEMGIPFLGEVPLDPRIGRSCDYGESFFEAFPDSPACTALKGVVRGLAEQIGIDSKLVLPDD